MNKAAAISSAEKIVSFGGICTCVGVVGDLLAPVGNYTLWSLVFGVVLTFAGFVMLSVLGRGSTAARGTLAFGAILSAVSVFFLAVAPKSAGDDGKGYLASKFDWLADAQDEFLGLSRNVENIAKDTAAIVQTTDRIEKNTDATLSLNFSANGFAEALASEDSINIAMYCERGYRANEIVHLLANSRNDNFSSDRNFSQLESLQCFDEAALCAPDNWVYQWRDLAPRLDEERVNALCGSEGVNALRERRAALLQQERDQEKERETKYRECVEKYRVMVEDVEPFCSGIHKRQGVF